MLGSYPRVACPHCGGMYERVPIAVGAQAHCRQCGYVLYQESSIPLPGWIALVLAALVTFVIANVFPLGTLVLAGKQVQTTLFEALRMTWVQGHIGLSLISGLFAFLFPLTQLLFLLWALLCLAGAKLPWDFAFGMRVLRLLAPWSMVSVLLLGIVVAIVKLAGMARLDPGPAIWAFAALSVLMTILSRATAHMLWRKAEDAGLTKTSGHILEHDQQPAAACEACGYVQPAVLSHCDRCRARVHVRKPDSVSRTGALVIAASILYIPANILPVMWVRTPEGLSSHTIIGGVHQLWQLGSWDLAVIVFVASVVVPMTKLLALMVLMLKRRWAGVAVQRQRTRLYELVEFIGQWSMLDVFVVVLLSAMADFPGLSQVQAGEGAFSFGLVVILTMLAALNFDPRRGWDTRPGGYNDRNKTRTSNGREHDPESYSSGSIG